MPERFDRFESAVHVLRALWSAAAATPPGVTRPDPFYPLEEATNEPPPLTPGGPPLWLGGQKRRGIALAAAVADGWLLPAVVALGSPSDLGYFSEKRDAFLAALDDAGRDPATFEIAAQVPDRYAPPRTGDGRSARRARRSTAVPRRSSSACRPTSAPPGVDAVAREIATPLREALGA